MRTLYSQAAHASIHHDDIERWVRSYGFAPEDVCKISALKTREWVPEAPDGVEGQLLIFEIFRNVDGIRFVIDQRNGRVPESMFVPEGQADPFEVATRLEARLLVGPMPDWWDTHTLEEL